MTLRLLLPAALVAFFATPPIDVVSAPDPPEWDAELRRRHGLSEIQRASRDNLIEFRRRRQLTAACGFKKVTR